MNGPVYLGSDGHLTDEALAQCLDAQAGGPTVLDPAIADHLDRCMACKGAIHELVLALRDTAYDGRTHQTREVGQSVRLSRRVNVRRAWPIAAALIPLIVVSAYYLSRPRPTVPLVSSEEDSLVISVPVDTVAVPARGRAEARPKIRTLVNPYLEELVRGTLRSASVRVISPPNDAVVDSVVEFAWEGPDVTPLTVRVLDVDGKTVFEQAASGNLLRWLHRLPAGVYYWKLESEEDLVFVGKFSVRDRR